MFKSGVNCSRLDVGRFILKKGWSIAGKRRGGVQQLLHATFIVTEKLISALAFTQILG